MVQARDKAKGGGGQQQTHRRSQKIGEVS